MLEDQARVMCDGARDKTKYLLYEIKLSYFYLNTIMDCVFLQNNAKFIDFIVQC